jgi:EPS-associated MarR family transcriptional regulator
MERKRMSVQLSGPSDRLDNEEALRIFREIDRSPEMTQREFSSRLGISLGKVNFLINALIRKGFVKVEHFKESNSKSKYLYCLTPRGIEEKSRMTSLFLKRKMREYENMELEIQQLRKEMRENGVDYEEQIRNGNGL